jgi:long-chain acyl-CoA synthetase
MSETSVSASVPDRVFGQARAFWDHPAQARRDGAHGFVSRSYGELAGAVRNVAERLRALGIGRGDRVLLLSATRPQWVEADLAIQCLGAVTVPVFPSLPAEQVALVATDSAVRLAIVESRTQAAKLPPELPGWIIEEEWPRGERLAPEAFQAWRSTLPAIGRHDLATIVYTSGTTAHSRGVMLTHRNLVANMEGLDAAAVGVPAMQVGPGDRALSFLPLSHIFERLVHLYFLSRGATLYYSAADRLLDDFPVVKPTLLVSVPRIYERIMAGVRQRAEASPLTRAVFRRAERVAVETGYAKAAGRRPPWSWVVYDRLVYRRIREALGGQLRYVISGGAALAPDLGAFFGGIGVPVSEGYGLTETSPVITVNRTDRIRYGTVGQPLPNLEVRLMEDGEICCRGDSVMAGYWNRPAETAEAIDAEGWFHTGDIGTLDADGYLRIVDRKKAILVLSTGKNVVPAPIEQALTESPWIRLAVVVGDGEKYTAVLLEPEPESLVAWAKNHGIPADWPALRDHPAVTAWITDEVRRRTARFADFEQPKTWAWLPRPLSEEAGELTPSLKVKRRAVIEHFPDVYRTLYPSA